VLPNLKSKFIFDDELSTKNKKKCFTLLVVISDEKNVIVKINKQNKEERFLKSEGVEVSNILSTKRTREKVTKTTTK
jgi:hypothetical protein